MTQTPKQIRVPDRLPTRISPCPIVEAVFEIRFVTTETWSTLPGLLYAAIRDRYPEKRDLPLAQIPEQVRASDPRLGLQPLIRFEAEQPFAVLCGPRLVALTTQPDRYPGWTEVETELRWLVSKVLKVGVIHEPERLGVRYIDFFERNLFADLRLGIAVDGGLLMEGEMQVNATFKQWQPFAVRLAIGNNATIKLPGGKARRGSVLDVDVGLGALDLEISEKSLLRRFGEAHQVNKQAFFGLLKSDFFSTLNPEYASDNHA